MNWIELKAENCNWHFKCKPDSLPSFTHPLEDIWLTGQRERVTPQRQQVRAGHVSSIAAGVQTARTQPCTCWVRGSFWFLWRCFFNRSHWISCSCSGLEKVWETRTSVRPAASSLHLCVFHVDQRAGESPFKVTCIKRKKSFTNHQPPDNPNPQYFYPFSCFLFPETKLPFPTHCMMLTNMYQTADGETNVWLPPIITRGRLDTLVCCTRLHLNLQQTVSWSRDRPLTGDDCSPRRAHYSYTHTYAHTHTESGKVWWNASLWSVWFLLIIPPSTSLSLLLL